MLRKIWAFIVEFLENVSHDPLAIPSELTMNQPATPSQTAYTPPTATETPKMDFLTHMATCIRDYEGKPGDLNYRNNNPGNCRCSKVGYASLYGNVICRNGFAVFPSYELGFLYLKNLIHERILQHPNWGLLDFMSVYAPTGDNNDPVRYANYIASRLGIDVHYPLSKCL